jgi:hypothetical protein
MKLFWIGKVFGYIQLLLWKRFAFNLLSLFNGMEFRIDYGRLQPNSMDKKIYL